MLRNEKKSELVRRTLCHSNSDCEVPYPIRAMKLRPLCNARQLGSYSWDSGKCATALQCEAAGACAPREVLGLRWSSVLRPEDSREGRSDAMSHFVVAFVLSG